VNSTEEKGLSEADSPAQTLPSEAANQEKKGTSEVKISSPWEGVDLPEVRVTVTAICKVCKMSRQNFYAAKHAREKLEVEEEIILEKVREKRNLLPRLGGRKLHKMLPSSLQEKGISIGRDRLFALLRKHQMLVPPLKAKGTKTTKYNKYLPVAKNLIQDLKVEKPNQVWVSDITYLHVQDGFAYLALITDVRSRKIVGWSLSGRLDTTNCLQALKMALKVLRPGDCPIHHSDRGVQYASHEYADALKKAGIQQSMTEERHCYENAKAERVNGILKQEFSLDVTFTSFHQCLAAVAQSIELYNTFRPHTALNGLTPAEVFGTLLQSTSKI